MAKGGKIAQRKMQSKIQRAALISTNTLTSLYTEIFGKFTVQYLTNIRLATNTNRKVISSEHPILTDQSLSTRQDKQRSNPFDEQLFLSASMRMMQKTLEGFLRTDVIKYSKKGIYGLGLPRYLLLIHRLTRPPPISDWSISSPFEMDYQKQQLWVVNFTSTSLKVVESFSASREFVVKGSIIHSITEIFWHCPFRSIGSKKWSPVFDDGGFAAARNSETTEMLSSGWMLLS